MPGFELTGWLGEGASGKVFVARREGTGELGQRVALKVGQRVALRVALRVGQEDSERMDTRVVEQA